VEVRERDTGKRRIHESNRRDTQRETLVHARPRDRKDRRCYETARERLRNDKRERIVGQAHDRREQFEDRRKMKEIVAARLERIAEMLQRVLQRLHEDAEIGARVIGCVTVFAEHCIDERVGERCKPNRALGVHALIRCGNILPQQTQRR